MPTKISTQDVLIYLNQLGYNNVNAQQLKEFVQDLKKLIKYEERKKSSENLQDDVPTVPLGDGLEKSAHKFSMLHLQGTCASKSKIVQKKESVISVQIKKSKSQHQCLQHDKENIVDSSPKIVSSKHSDKAEDLLEEPLKENQNDNLSDGSKISLNKKPSNTLKPKSSFIRPSMAINNKSDPVALYHQYQAGWKRQKFPGEDNRTSLRWAIREKMCRAPRVSRA